LEENNFGIRKRLLEYDDVMNKQRTVIYARRNHALFGERLALDLDNAFYNVAEGLVTTFKESNDFEEFKLSVIVNFGVDTTISQEEFERADAATLSEKLYQEAMDNYRRKSDILKQEAYPVFQNIRKEQGTHIENVFVPFTDGKRGLQVLSNMEKTLNSKGAELVNALERTAVLAFIDEAWKEHLRAMDDLKTSVQSAYLEQKDPLVIYKVEAFQLFKQMDSDVNKNIVSFLSHCGLPAETQQNTQSIREGKQQRTDMSKMRQRKEEMVAAGAGGVDMLEPGNDYIDPSQAIKQEPVKVEPKIGRNEPCPCGSGKKYKNCHGKEA
jgi:preprotein translocase subunit SecA